APCPAETLDVLVLVEGGDALRRELAAYPVRLLEEAHAAPGPRGGKGGRDAACPTPHDEDVADPLLDAPARLAAVHQRRAGIARRPHRHHVEQSSHGGVTIRDRACGPRLSYAVRCQFCASGFDL